MPNKKNNSKTVETLMHDEATRKNIPTAEYQSVMREAEVGYRESGIGCRGMGDRSHPAPSIEYPVSSIQYRVSSTQT